MPETLTSLQRLRRRLAGDPVDRAPNFDIIMAYGVRHISASRIGASRTSNRPSGVRLRDYYLDYHTLVEMNLAMLEDFSLDIVQAISDPYREACDWGLEVEFPEDDLPMRRKPLLMEPEDITRLKRPDPSTGRRMSDRIEAVRAFKAQVGGSVPVMGWVEGALAEANDLRGDTALLTDLYDRPGWLVDLLEILTEVEIAFARAQVEAGADIIGLGDAIASTISPKMYRAFALPNEQRIFAAVKAMGAIPRLHICGNTTRILPDMAQSGAEIIDLDWMVDFGQAAQLVENSRQATSSENQGKPAANIRGEDPGIALCGNFDPVQVMLRGTAEEVYNAVRACLEAGGPRCISAAGCEIPIGTPPENIHAQNRALREYHEIGGV
jgi:MtaA/CmuA family methyltransferase